MSESAADDQGRILTLDGLRGIAIALFLLYHFDFAYELEFGRESGWFIDGIVTA